MARPERLELPTTWFEARGLCFNLLILNYFNHGRPLQNAGFSTTKYNSLPRNPTVVIGGTQGCGASKKLCLYIVGRAYVNQENGEFG